MILCRTMTKHVLLRRAAPEVYCQLYQTCSAVQGRRAELRGMSDWREVGRVTQLATAETLGNKTGAVHGKMYNFLFFRTIRMAATDFVAPALTGEREKGGLPGLLGEDAN